MKKLLATTMGIAMASVAIFAQPNPKHLDKKNHHKHHHSRMAAMKHLNLTEDQKQQMKSATASFKQQMQELNKDENQTVKELRNKRAELVKAQKAQFENMLTTEQKNQLADLKVKATEKAQEHMAKRFDKMKETLGLSNEQAAKLKSTRELAMAKLKNIKADESLDRAAKKQQALAIKTELKNNFENTLTTDQKAKLETYKAAQKNKMKDRIGQSRKQNEKK